MIKYILKNYYPAFLCIVFSTETVKGKLTSSKGGLGIYKGCVRENNDKIYNQYLKGVRNPTVDKLAIMKITKNKKNWQDRQNTLLRYQTDIYQMIIKKI